MLSQIERGQANPTFAVLWSLTRALKLDFADLLQGAAGPKEDGAIEVVAAANTPEIRSADGRCRLQILGPPRLAGATEWYEVAMGPGGELVSAPHARGAFEHFTALDGTSRSAAATRRAGSRRAKRRVLPPTSPIASPMSGRSRRAAS